MRNKNNVVWLSVVFLLGLVVLVGANGNAVTESVTVSNLESPHPVKGDLRVSTPIPHSDMAQLTDVIVAPATRHDTGLWADAGTLTTDGFTTVVLSMHGQLKGTPSSPGTVHLVLVPEEESILRALGEGELHLSLEAIAETGPRTSLYFSGARARLPIGFPSYRVFLYNTTDRSAAVNIFAYLAH